MALLERPNAATAAPNARPPYIHNFRLSLRARAQQPARKQGRPYCSCEAWSKGRHMWHRCSALQVCRRGRHCGHQQLCCPAQSSTAPTDDKAITKSCTVASMTWIQAPLTTLSSIELVCLRQKDGRPGDSGVSKSGHKAQLPECNHRPERYTTVYTRPSDMQPALRRLAYILCAIRGGRGRCVSCSALGKRQGI